MKVTPDCVPCYIRQLISTMRFAGVEENKINSYLNGLFPLIPELTLEASPALNSSILLKRLYELLNEPDPYKAYKIRWNEYILDRYAYLEQLVRNSDDALLAALKVSVAGNIIDMGILPEIDINSAIDEITDRDFDHNDYSCLRNSLGENAEVLLLGDNCGEIVFDRVLAEELTRLGHKVIYAVKSTPLLNDATMEDAEQINFSAVCRVIENGSSVLGTEKDFCSEEFLTVYKKADIVISKGQANFESLEGSRLAGDKTWFLLRAKCDLVARYLGVSTGSIVLLKNRS